MRPAMTHRTLIPQALTDTAFAPFGRVLQVPADGRGGPAINPRRSQRFELAADALLTAEAGRPVLEQRGAVVDGDLADLASPVRLAWTG
jgi:ureidoglycolate hydrolase